MVFIVVLFSLKFFRFLTNDARQAIDSKLVPQSLYQSTETDTDSVDRTEYTGLPDL